MGRRDWRFEAYEQLAQEHGFYPPEVVDDYEIEADVLDEGDSGAYKTCGQLADRCSVCGETRLIGETMEIAGNFGIKSDDPVCLSCVATLQSALRRFILPVKSRAKDARELVAEESPTAKRSRRSAEVSASRQEVELLAIVRDIFPNHDIWVNRFYDWLPAPKTREPMQLDLFVPALNIAFEYDGPHHSQVTKGRRVTDLSKQYFRDITKTRLCEKRGVSLIRIDYREPLTKSLVLDKLKSKGCA